MLEAIFKKIHDIKHLILVFRLILGAQVENDGLAPFIELTDLIEQADDKLAGNVDATFVCCDFVDGLNCIDNNKSIVVRG